MSSFLTSSIGKKFIMSISGFFLMTFLIVHLIINLMLMIGDGSLFNQAAHFMVSNPVIRIIEPVLAIGFIIHMVYACFITLTNRLSRPVTYRVGSKQIKTTLASRNMFVLGSLISIFLAIHIVNFWWKIKFGTIGEVIIDGEHVHNTYALVSGLFIKYWWYNVIYMLGAVFLGLHLQHGFWSAFQTIGFSNDLWRKRLNRFGAAFTIVIAGGFFIIPLFFLIFKL